MAVDWGTIGALLVGGLAGGVLSTGLLKLWQGRRQLAHTLNKDAWVEFCQNSEKQIEVLDAAGDTDAANLARRKYAAQHEAWGAQQGVIALAPREIRPDGKSSLTAEDLKQLINELAASRSLNPAALSAEDLFFRGNSFYDAGEYEDAQGAYNRSLELRPDDSKTLNNRGSTLNHLGRTDEALTDFSRSLELRPDDPKTLYNHGNALSRLGRYQDALTDFTRSLKLKPDDALPLNNRGNALTRLGRNDEAMADYSRSLELRPNDPTPLYNVACLHAVAGRYVDALQWLAKAINGDTKYRVVPVTDNDFAALRAHTQFRDRFRLLVAGDADN